MEAYPFKLLASPALIILIMSAGFTSSIEDYHIGNLDLNRYLIKHPAATFFMRMKGDAMVSYGIFHHDLLIVDLALNQQLSVESV